MTYIPDLVRKRTNGGQSSQELTAVGWLDPKHAFTQGQVAAAVIERLVAICRTRYVVEISLGYHECLFCGTSEWYYDVELQRNLGNHNYLVPGEGGTMYCFPDLMLHYIRDHGYAPPATFCEAVLNCPDPETPEYLQAVNRYVLQQRVS